MVLNVGYKLGFLLCTVVSCFNHVATIETSHLQSGNEKINLKSEKHGALETEDEGGTFKANLIIDLKGNQNETKELLKSGWVSIKIKITYLQHNDESFLTIRLNLYFILSQ